MAKVLSQKLKVALVQLAATADKAKNLSRVKEHVLKAASNGAQLVVLPGRHSEIYAIWIM